jgi:hypothetical protein
MCWKLNPPKQECWEIFQSWLGQKGSALTNGLMSLSWDRACCNSEFGAHFSLTHYLTPAMSSTMLWHSKSPYQTQPLDLGLPCFRTMIQVLFCSLYIFQPMVFIITSGQKRLKLFKETSHVKLCLLSLNICLIASIFLIQQEARQ